MALPWVKVPESGWAELEDVLLDLSREGVWLGMKS